MQEYLTDSWLTDTKTYALPPNIWGPSCWKVLHYVSLHSPANRYYTQLLQFVIKLIPNIIPCSDCRKHARDYMTNSNDPAKANTVNELATYLFEFHNEVNKRLGKPILKYSELSSSCKFDVDDLWYTLYYMCVGYPNTEREYVTNYGYKAFYNRVCELYLGKDSLFDNDLYFTNRTTLFNRIYELHRENNMSIDRTRIIDGIASIIRY